MKLLSAFLLLCGTNSHYVIEKIFSTTLLSAHSFPSLNSLILHEHNLHSADVRNTTGTFFTCQSVNHYEKRDRAIVAMIDHRENTICHYVLSDKHDINAYHRYILQS